MDIYMVHGMKRSGNHAIINWLLYQEKIFFINDIIPIDKFLKKNGDNYFNKNFYSWYFGQLKRSGKGIFDIRQIYENYRSPLMMSMEDHRLDITPFENMPNIKKNILIIRDPVNLFASRIKKAKKIMNTSKGVKIVYPFDKNDLMMRVIDTWKMHAKEYLGMTNYLENKVSIFYNKWHTDLEYRKNISGSLGFEFNDKGKEILAEYGGGSSFSGKDQSDVKSMDVLNRVSNLDDDERELLEKVMEDTELYQLNQMILKT